MSQHDPEKRPIRNDMAKVVYVGLQDDDKIVTFCIEDADVLIADLAQAPDA